MAEPSDYSKSTIDSAVHRSTVNTDRINRATERVAAGDDQFIRHALSQLEGLRFPAFKHKILDHVREKTDEGDVIGLFESLNGYIAYRDAYHVQKAVEENGTKYKVQNQISDETRQHPNFARPAGAAGASRTVKSQTRAKKEKTIPKSRRPRRRISYATCAARLSRTRTTLCSTSGLKGSRAIPALLPKAPDPRISCRQGMPQERTCRPRRTSQGRRAGSR